MTSRQKSNARADRLRPTFLKMDADAAQEIRSDYYKAAEGLIGLVAELERQTEQYPELAGELRHAKAALGCGCTCAKNAVI